MNFIKEANKHVFIFFNKTGLRGQNFFYALWNSLNSLNEWNNIEKKIIMISFINPKTEEVFYITKNFVITKSTTPEIYWEEIKNNF